MHTLTDPTPLFLGSFALATLLVVLRTFALRRERFDGVTLRFTLRDHLDLAAWSFSNSWASNLTTVSALLGTVLSFSFPLPAHPALSRQDYIGLSLFFGALVVVAAFAYNGTRRVSTVASGGSATDEYHGFIITFLIACGMILWAVLGELVTLWLLLSDISQGSPGGSPPFSSLIFVMLRALLLGSFAIVLYYAWQTIGGTIYWAMQDHAAVSDGAPAPSSRRRRRSLL